MQNTTEILHKLDAIKSVPDNVSLVSLDVTLGSRLNGGSWGCPNKRGVEVLRKIKLEGFQ